jgi:hypothetical protein
MLRSENGVKTVKIRRGNLIIKEGYFGQEYRFVLQVMPAGKPETVFER